MIDFHLLHLGAMLGSIYVALCLIRAWTKENE